MITIGVILVISEIIFSVILCATKNYLALKGIAIADVIALCRVCYNNMGCFKHFKLYRKERLRRLS